MTKALAWDAWHLDGLEGIVKLANDLGLAPLGSCLDELRVVLAGGDRVSDPVGRNLRRHLQRWGQPRMTADVDLTVVTGFGGEEKYVDALLASFRGRIEDARDFALRHRTLLLAASNGVHVEFDRTCSALA